MYLSPSAVRSWPVSECQPVFSPGPSVGIDFKREDSAASRAAGPQEPINYDRFHVICTEVITIHGLSRVVAGHVAVVTPTCPKVGASPQTSLHLGPY